MSKNKVLLLEGIHSNAANRLEAAGFEVHTESRALAEPELVERLQGFDALGIRSKTHVTANALSACPDLKAIGAFCIGTNQVDLNHANFQGVSVFNAPYSNTRSVAELVIAEMIALSRRLTDLSQGVHAGRWDKSATGAHEVRGKNLGIVGYGHIGSQVSVLAEALGLRVYFFDIVKKLPMGNAQPVSSLAELLRLSDFVTVHVPETPFTKGMIGKKELEQMRANSFLLNLSRGSVIDLVALAAAINSKHLAGAAIDVYPHEPESNKETFRSELQGLKNVILTPHIGGSTEEAQEAIGLEVAESLVRYFRRGSTLGAVNFPIVDVPAVGASHRLINIHKNVPGVLSQINSLISKEGLNIQAQYLSTDENIGFLVLDIESPSVSSIEREISRLGTSIQTWSIPPERL